MTRRAPWRRAARGAALGFLLVVGVVAAGPVASADDGGAADGAGWWWRRTRQPSLVCGQLPTVDVVLRADLTCATGFHFGPTDPAVTIDLGGHTLTVPGDAGACTAPGPCGAIAGALAVRNGAVVGTLTDIGEVSRVIVHGDVALRLGFAGPGGPATLRNSFVLDGTVQIWGPSVTVTSNLIRGGIDLVSTNTAIRDVSITRNWVVASPRAGIAVRPPFGAFPDDVDGVISGNVVAGATGPGIELSGGLDNIGTLAIERNLLVGNGDSGFRSGTDGPGPPVATGGPVTLTENLALFNRGHGIEAGWVSASTGTGIVDGGGNRAAFDAEAPECLGVTCPS